MNWLAHLALSEPVPEFKIGNLLADILPITELRELPAAYQPGVLRHRAIDSFTDKHEIFRRSVARLDTRYRRFGGVIMDIFYDHLLTQRWSVHCTQPLKPFVDQFFVDVEACHDSMPAGAYTIFQRMRTGGWLTSYGDIDGVRVTLHRISRRLRRPVDLASAADELERLQVELDQDFALFFPLIRSQFATEAPLVSR
jgi:acyl carrier protein phosphodiesterase